jgi:hypothetical protein
MKYDDSSMEVRFNETTGQQHLHTTKSFQPGDVITSFGARETLTLPSYLTLQIGQDSHILLSPEELQYCNHSCDPTVFFDTTRMELQALKQIESGDELTFFYPSTEWDMAQPFQCFCGSAACLGMIQGASQMQEDALKTYRLTDFINRQLVLRLSVAEIPVTT